MTTTPFVPGKLTIPSWSLTKSNINIVYAKFKQQYKHKHQNSVAANEAYVDIAADVPIMTMRSDFVDPT